MRADEARKIAERAREVKVLEQKEIRAREKAKKKLEEDWTSAQKELHNAIRDVRNKIFIALTNGECWITITQSFLVNLERILAAVIEIAKIGPFRIEGLPPIFNSITSSGKSGVMNCHIVIESYAEIIKKLAATEGAEKQKLKMKAINALLQFDATRLSDIDEKALNAIIEKIEREKDIEEIELLSAIALAGSSALGLPRNYSSIIKGDVNKDQNHEAKTKQIFFQDVNKKGVLHIFWKSEEYDFWKTIHLKSEPKMPIWLLRFPKLRPDDNSDDLLINPRLLVWAASRAGQLYIKSLFTCIEELASEGQTICRLTCDEKGIFLFGNPSKTADQFGKKSNNKIYEPRDFWIQYPGLFAGNENSTKFWGDLLCANQYAIKEQNSGDLIISW
jgi:hypothetical protein